MESKENFKDSTYDLAKALHHVSISKQYFEMIGAGYHKGAKDLMNLYARKQDWLIKDIYDRLSDESRQFYKESLIAGDTVFASYISEQLLLINEQDKKVVEFIVDCLVKGKRIEVNVLDEALPPMPTVNLIV